MIRKEWNAGLMRIIISGVMGIAGYLLILVAFTIERVSYIVDLRQTSIIFAVFMGSYFLKEKHKGIRLAGALVILSGGGVNFPGTVSPKGWKAGKLRRREIQKSRRLNF